MLDVVSKNICIYRHASILIGEDFEIKKITIIFVVHINCRHVDAIPESDLTALMIDVRFLFGFKFFRNHICVSHSSACFIVALLLTVHHTIFVMLSLQIRTPFIPVSLSGTDPFFSMKRWAMVCGRLAGCRRRLYGWIRCQMGVKSGGFPSEWGGYLGPHLIPLER